jgi:predicted nucleic acid-binding protein
MIAPDTSVTIAAAAPWHVAHDAAVTALAAERSSLISQVAYETTAAMSRMPEGQRLAPTVVIKWLDRKFPTRWLVLPADAARAALRAAVENGIRGGALYDAVIAATASHHDYTLLSADRRAAPVYAAFGLDVVYIDAD